MSWWDAVKRRVPRVRANIGKNQLRTRSPRGRVTTVLVCVLAGLMMTVAALSARTPSGETAWGWMQRLVVQGVIGLVGPLLDLIRLSRLRRRRKGLPVWAVALFVVLALAGIGAGAWYAYDQELWGGHTVPSVVGLERDAASANPEERSAAIAALGLARGEALAALAGLEDEAPAAMGVA